MRDPSTIHYSSGLIAAYGSFSVGVVYLDSVKNRAVSKVSLEAWREISCKTYSHLLTLDNDFHFNPSNKTRIFTLYKAHQYIERNIKQSLAYFMPIVLDMSISLTYLTIFCGWQFSFCFMTTIALYSRFTFLTNENRKPAISKQKELDAMADSKLRDALANISNVKYFNGEQREVARYNSLISENVRFSNENIATLGQLNFGQKIISNTGLTICLLLAISGVKAGTMTIGDVVFLQSLLIAIMSPLNFLGMFSREFSESLVEISSLMELRDIKSSVTEKVGAKDFDNKTGEIELRNVSFQYGEYNKESGKKILNNFSMKIAPGSFVSIIGPSGIGKSTIFSLLFRFSDPNEGSVFINGEDISDIKLASLRNEIGIVSQTTSLFNESILYNLQYAKPNATFDEIVEVCKKVKLHDVILNMPKGYESPVGEGGTSLSGGERQRLGLARALLKNCSILLLDEVTSALDSVNERNILDILASLKGKTIIAITHRLNMNIHVDKVFMMSAGGDLIEGTHEELLEREWRYKEMFQSYLQKKGDDIKSI